MSVEISEKMKVIESTILYNCEIRPNYFRIGFECSYVSKAKPGQFLSISINGVEKNMPIRRPFTIYKIMGDKVEIIYKVKGKGTKLFTKLKKGDKINILGPLGNTFEIVKNSNSLVIGRGAGLATLANLGSSLKDAGCKVTTIASFRDESVNFIDDFIKGFSDKLIVVTDEDSSSDLKNVRKIIDEVKPDVIYCSGSKRIARLLQKLDYKSYVSLEERMGCGLGACVTCSVMTRTGYKRVCKDGPAFDVKEVIL